MINNFDNLREFLVFESNDDFYQLQLIKRRKDGNDEMPSNNVIVAVYTVKSLDHFDKLKDDVIAICEATNTRAYLNLNKKSFKRTTLEMLKTLADTIATDQFTSNQGLFHSVAGKFNSHTNKKIWVVDIDDREWYSKNRPHLLSYLHNLQPLGDKILGEVLTKNGFHLLTTPFNLYEYKKDTRFSDIDIHKNNPTVLYCK